MIRYVAFLRAINVGGHTVKMDLLQRVFRSLGYVNVETILASGNVVFESPVRDRRSIERRIADELQIVLGYEVVTFIRSMPELSAIAQFEPFMRAQGHGKLPVLYIGFLAEPLSRQATRKLLSFKSEVDDLRAHQSEVYWLCAIRSSESEFSLACLEKELGIRSTFRNATTVRKIAERFGAG
jgi:uncharacterized protein (DUF1697 family)